MQATYKINLEITATFSDIKQEEVKKLKSNSEYADAIATLICDEIATAGGVGTYSINESSVDLNKTFQESVYADFLKSSRH